MKSSDFFLSMGETYVSWKEYFRDRKSYQTSQISSPILITGAYRTGTTWVGDMLAGNGIWSLHEPFNPNKGYWQENFVYPSVKVKKHEEINNYVNALLSGGIVTGKDNQTILKGIYANRMLMPSRLGLYPSPPAQVIIKDPIACLMSDYLCKQFNFKVLVLIRHPAGFSSSLKYLKWDESVKFQLQKLYQNDELIQIYLAKYLPLFDKINYSSSLEVFTFFYASLYKILTKFVESNARMFMVQYEHLCLNVETEFRSIYSKLGLSYTNEDSQRHEIFTNAPVAKKKATPFSTMRNSRSSAETWRQRLSGKEINTIRNTWDQFDFDLYKADDDW